MQKLLLNSFAFPLVLVLLMLSGCRMPEGPDAIGYHFLSALADQDFETAKEYSTIETSMMLDIMAEMLKAQPTQPPKEVNQKIKLKDTEIDQGDSSATCVFTINEAEDVPIQLKKRNGVWKAHLVFNMPQDVLSEQDIEFEELPDAHPLGDDSINIDH
jgi:hypothetical protein